MIQELLNLKRLAEKAGPLPKGTRSSNEARFYAKAREMVPALVDELLRTRATAPESQPASTLETDER